MDVTAMAIRFITADGTEVPAVDTEQMREVDRIAVEETGPNLYQMMENAGRNLALLTIEALGQGWKRAQILVLAGSGGNGGGGICAARHLANRDARVAICLADAAGLGRVLAFQHKVLQSTSAKEIEFQRITEHRPDLVVDALIGYGLQQAPKGHAEELIAWAMSSQAPVLSLDIPSGVDSTTGQTPGVFIKARWTLTLALPKKGLLPQHTGDLFVGDIGIPAAVYERIGVNYVSPFGQDYYVRLKNQ